MKSLRLPLGLVCAILAASPAILSADTLALFDFGTSTVSLAPSSTAVDLSVSSIAAGSAALNLVRSGATFGPSGASALGLSRIFEPLNATPTFAITAGNWIAFSVTPDAGFTTTVDSLSFYANINSATASANTVTVQARVGDVSNAYVTLGTAVITTVGGATPGSLYSVSFNSLTDVTHSLSFRLVFSNPSASGNWTDYTRIDDLTVTGTLSSIPEPSTFALVTALVGLATVIGRRRRSRY